MLKNSAGEAAIRHTVMNSFICFFSIRELSSRCSAALSLSLHVEHQLCTCETQTWTNPSIVDNRNDSSTEIGDQFIQRGKGICRLENQERSSRNVGLQVSVVAT